MRAGPVPASRRGPDSVWSALGHALLFHVAADVVDAHVVGVVEVVAEIEFGEPERDDEFGVGGAEGGGAEEGYCEVGPGRDINSVKTWMGRR